MKPLTIETVYHNGLIEIPGNVQFNQPMRVLVVFFDKYQPKEKMQRRFSFEESLELTKDCEGSLSDLVIDERRNEGMNPLFA